MIKILELVHVELSHLQGAFPQHDICSGRLALLEHAEEFWCMPIGRDKASVSSDYRGSSEGLVDFFV